MPRERESIEGCCHITYIYGLCDPRTGTIHYVGKSDRPHRRFSQHLTDARWMVILSKKESWIRSILSSGRKPLLKILAIVPYDDWRRQENFWIQRAMCGSEEIVNSVPHSWHNMTQIIRRFGKTPNLHHHKIPHFD